MAWWRTTARWPRLLSRLLRVGFVEFLQVLGGIFLEIADAILAAEEDEAVGLASLLVRVADRVAHFIEVVIGNDARFQRVSGALRGGGGGFGIVRFGVIGVIRMVGRAQGEGEKRGEEGSGKTEEGFHADKGLCVH
jgi:hypothetical protein